MAEGYRVKRTKLTPEFTLDKFRERWGTEAVALFVLDDGKVQVVTPETKIRQAGITLVALVPPEPPQGHQSADEQAAARSAARASAR